MRYRFVQGQLGQFPVAALCRVMHVTRSGYYAWQRREPSERQKHDETLLDSIRQFFERSKRTYGSPRILRDLKEAGLACGKHRVARLMRQSGLRSVIAPRFRTTTDSRHSLPVAQNLLDRDFAAPAANRKWASDITYLGTGQGWLYLVHARVNGAVVLDLILAPGRGLRCACATGSMQATLDRSLVLGALESAFGHRRPEAGLIHHSDPVTCGD